MCWASQEKKASGRFVWFNCSPHVMIWRIVLHMCITMLNTHWKANEDRMTNGKYSFSTFDIGTGELDYGQVKCVAFFIANNVYMIHFYDYFVWEYYHLVICIYAWKTISIRLSFHLSFFPFSIPTTDKMPHGDICGNVTHSILLWIYWKKPIKVGEMNRIQLSLTIWDERRSFLFLFTM